MKKKSLFLIIILLVLSHINLLSDENRGKEILNNLSKKNKIKLAMLLLPNSFLLSREYKEYKWTLYRFFKEKIYDELTGNPYLGYDYDEGLKYKGNKIQIEVLRTTLKFNGKGYEQLFGKILRKVLKKNEYKEEKNCRYKLGICIVNVNEEFGKDKAPWVWVELYIRDSELKKTYFLRYSVASKKGILYAINFLSKRILLELGYHHG